jgi:hypothetical protein
VGIDVAAGVRDAGEPEHGAPRRSLALDSNVGVVGAVAVAGPVDLVGVVVHKANGFPIWKRIFAIWLLRGHKIRTRAIPVLV